MNSYQQGNRACFFADPIGLKFIEHDERLQAMDAQGVTARVMSLTQAMVRRNVAC